jgi:pimeloyl-ACP methyl ester carboxylesterase
MSGIRIHRAVSADGTEIAGRVHGDGPPLVLVQPPIVDADMAYGALLPHLTDRFTCYLPSLRGREPSGDNPEHSPSRFQEDVNAFVDSIGEPVRLTGWSDGASLALGSAAHSDAVTAVAVYEPGVWNLAREDFLARFGDAIEHQMEAVADGRSRDAALIFLRFVCTDDEFAALDADYLDRQASLHPLVMQEVPQEVSYDGPQPTDPEMLAQIDAPVLVLLGQQTHLATWFTDSAHYVARHAAKAHVRELPGIGHFAPLVAPEPIAEELISFFASARRPEPA